MVLIKYVECLGLTVSGAGDRAATRSAPHVASLRPGRVSATAAGSAHAVVAQAGLRRA